jgi:hypothetical protein
LRCKIIHTIFKGIAILGLYILGIGLNQANNAIPSTAVISTDQLYAYLTSDAKARIKEDNDAAIAAHFRDQFANRYFYDWHNNTSRYQDYQEVYNNNGNHEARAKIHKDLFRGSTTWKLPMKSISGEDISAYKFRHLSRQHKMVDIALTYYAQGKDQELLKYFTNQVNSLSLALSAGEYERIENGNGVLEAFRSGYRVLNWLQIHNLFLGEETYSDQDQLQTISVLLQHGQHLYENNTKFRPGNHQTKGMSSLALLGILFKDFEGTDLWLELAMTRLKEHLVTEINDDGFQFERTVHYHMSDIANYFYVYQLVQKNHISIDPLWEERLKSLFTTLVKISYPDGTAPVLSDDTDNPWAEKNDIDGALTIGYLLFGGPTYGYFAKKKVDSKTFWFVNSEQINSLKLIKAKKPTYKSLSFPDTKYYIMREGYDKGDKMMVISAGKDAVKPDHQHGDILGIQANAFGEIILPNYQVRYSLPDYEFFKNSMVKNVALVDDEVQGKKYKGNKGGSGFGKFKELPQASVIAWETSPTFDLFVGSHNGFQNINVAYNRQVIYVRDKFWIVKDNFKSDSTHTYKQVWQGHYTQEGSSDFLTCSFDEAVGCDIYQLNTTDTAMSYGQRGKHGTVIMSEKQKDYSFISIIYPYKGYDQGIKVQDAKISVAGYSSVCSNISVKGAQVKTLCNDNNVYAFGAEEIIQGKSTISFSQPCDVYLEIKPDEMVLHSINSNVSNIELSNGFILFGQNGKGATLYSVRPGETITIKTTNK